MDGDTITTTIHPAFSQVADEYARLVVTSPVLSLAGKAKEPEALRSVAAFKATTLPEVEAAATPLPDKHESEIPAKPIANAQPLARTTSSPSCKRCA